MEVTNISPLPRTRPPADQALPPQVESGVPASPHSAALTPLRSPGKATADAAAPTVRVEVEPHRGTQTVTVFDVRTGQPIFQLPPRQVVKILDEVLERTQEREARDGQ